MHAQKNKSNGNKSKAVANVVGQKKSSGGQGFGFMDNRIESVTQRKLQSKSDGFLSQLIQRKVKSAPIFNVVAQFERLRIQQGPSCWLFVLEAVVEAHGVNTNSINHIMRSYPTTEEAIDHQQNIAAANPGITKRGAAVALIAQRVTELRDKLNRLKVYVGGNGNISREAFLKMLERSKVSTTIINEFNWGGAGNADVNGVLDVVNRVRDKALILAAIVQNEADDVGSLLQTGMQTVDKNQRKNDVHLTLNQLVLDHRLPVYLHIRKRFKLNQEERGAHSVDLTKRYDEKMEESNHAVLLTNYNSQNRNVTYKDPNYGNVQIIISYKQFQKMGGDHEIKIRPFIAEGQMRSNLRNVAD